MRQEQRGHKARQRQCQGLPGGVLPQPPASPSTNSAPCGCFTEYSRLIQLPASLPSRWLTLSPSFVGTLEAAGPWHPDSQPKAPTPSGISHNHRKPGSSTTIFSLTVSSLEQAQGCPQSKLKKTCPRTHSRDQSRSPGTSPEHIPVPETLGRMPASGCGGQLL